MANVLIVAYLLIVLALIAVILLQRSEGGGLGMGSNSAGGLISVRGSANILTRTTAILATLFFVTAIGLTILAELDRSSRNIIARAADPVTEDGATTAPGNVLDALNQLNSQGGDETAPTAPETTAPVTTTDPALAIPTSETPAAPVTPAPATETAPAADTTTAPATIETPPADNTSTPAATTPAPAPATN